MQHVVGTPVQGYCPCQGPVYEARWSQALMGNKWQGDLCLAMLHRISTSAEFACRVARSYGFVTRVEAIEGQTAGTLFTCVVRPWAGIVLFLVHVTKLSYCLHRRFKDIGKSCCVVKVAHHGNRVNENADWKTIRVHISIALLGNSEEVFNDTL